MPSGASTSPIDVAGGKPISQGERPPEMIYPMVAEIVFHTLNLLCECMIRSEEGQTTKEDRADGNRGHPLGIGAGIAGRREPEDPADRLQDPASRTRSSKSVLSQHI